MTILPELPPVTAQHLRDTELSEKQLCKKTGGQNDIQRDKNQRGHTELVNNYF